MDRCISHEGNRIRRRRWIFSLVPDHPRQERDRAFFCLAEYLVSTKTSRHRCRRNNKLACAERAKIAAFSYALLIFLNSSLGVARRVGVILGKGIQPSIGPDCLNGYSVDLTTSSSAFVTRGSRLIVMFYHFSMYIQIWLFG